MTNISTTEIWHSLTIEEAIAYLDVNPEIGLESWQVSDRQGVYGRNELKEKSVRTKLSIFIDQFTYENPVRFLVEKIKTSSSLNLEVPGKNLK